MFLSSDQQCSGMPNSTNSPCAADIARSNAQMTSIDTAKVKANADWLNLLSRDWTSYADFGKYVASQALNSSPEINPASLATGIILSDPSITGSGTGTTVVAPAGVRIGTQLQPSTGPATGVNVVSQGNPTGSNPVGGGDLSNPSGMIGPGGNSFTFSGPRGSNGNIGGGGTGVGKWNTGNSGNTGGGSGNSFLFSGPRGGVPAPPIGSTAPGGVIDPSNPASRYGRGRSGTRHSPQQVLPAAFIQRFGTTPSQVTYTGPLPRPGSPLSLVVGGQNRPLAVGGGSYPSATPDSRFGYNTNCPSPTGINANPYGEPFYTSANSAGGASGSSSSGIGTGTVLAGLVLLAGLVFLTSDNEKKRGRG